MPAFGKFLPFGKGSYILKAAIFWHFRAIKTPLKQSANIYSK
jgi:hypothetical protein